MNDEPEVIKEEEEEVTPEPEVTTDPEVTPEPEVTTDPEPEPTPEPLNLEEIKVEIRKREEEAIDYGDDIDPDDVKTIGSIVEKQTAAQNKRTREIEDKLDVTTFIAEKPEFAKYKGAILKHMTESPDVYGRIPVKNIASMLAADDLMKLGAKKEREAQTKVDATKTPGNTVRTPQGGQKDWSKVSKEEFEAQKMEVLYPQR